MMQSSLKKLLLIAAIASCPLVIKADSLLEGSTVSWYPSGMLTQSSDRADSVTYAYYDDTEDVTYIGGDIIDGTTDLFESDYNDGSWDIYTSDGIAQLDIYGTLADPEVGPDVDNYLDADECPLKVNGTVQLVSEGDGEGGSSDLQINIMTPTTIMPYINPLGDEFGVGTGGDADWDAVYVGNSDYDEKKAAQLYFYADAGNKITVNAYYDLTFLGRTLGYADELSRKEATKATEEECTEIEPLDMILTFAGEGQTIFKLTGGVTVTFSGDIDTCNPVNVCDDYAFTGLSNNAGGTKVFVTMEQTRDDIDYNVNKLVFQRDLFSDDEVNPDTDNAYEDDRVAIEVGYNSVITFLSDDYTGIKHEDSESSDTYLNNFGAIAFDPSNYGEGRMVLFIRGAYEFGWDTDLFTEDDPGYSSIYKKYPLNEGAIIVQGHAIYDGVDDDDPYSPENVRQNIEYEYPAGGQAYFRVIDNLRYGAWLDDEYSSETYAPANNERNGLLVVNDCQSVTKRLQDPYLDIWNDWDEDSLDGFLRTNKTLKSHARGQKNNTRMSQNRASAVNSCTFSDDTYSCFAQDAGSPETIYGRGYSPAWNDKNVRNGFIVGINGALDIYDKCNFDYVAGSVNQPDLLAWNDYQNNKVLPGTLFKDKNPAALIFDGVDEYLYNSSFGPLSAYWDTSFEAADKNFRDRPIHASVYLRGDAALIARACGSSDVGYIPKLWWFYDDPMDLDVDWDHALFAGTIDYSDVYAEIYSNEEESTFDGYVLSSIPHTNLPGEAVKCADDNWTVKQSGEGQHVIEFEGQTTFRSLPNTSIKDADSDEDGNVVDRLYPEEVVDKAGWLSMPATRIDAVGGAYHEIPLNRDSNYDRYNSPALFLNNNVAFFDTHIVHTDNSKLVNGNPAQSEPAIVGGERAFFISQLFTAGEEGDIYTDGGSDSVDSISDRNRWRLPEIQLYNSKLHLYESLCSAGVRWVVKDIPWALAPGLEAPGIDSTDITNQSAVIDFTNIDTEDFSNVLNVETTDGNNSSTVVLYNHDSEDAESYDDSEFLGHGRILQQGSIHNTLADGHTSVWSTQSSYWNIFKQLGYYSNGEDDEDNSFGDYSTVNLSLKTGVILTDDYDFYDLTLGTSTGSENTSAHHLILNSVMSDGGTNVALGWYETMAPWYDVDGAPVDAYPYDNTAYPSYFNYYAKESKDYLDDSSTVIHLDALKIPPATVSIDGNFICWGGFDADGNPVKGPINRANNQGVIYVNHGGMLTIGEKPEDDTIEFQTVIDTVVAQKVFNDYDADGTSRDTQFTGIVDLPHDQTTFALGAGVQPYGFMNSVLFNTEHTDETNGYVRLSFDNGDNRPNRVNADRSGAEEVILNWFNREGDNHVADKVPLRAPVGSFKALSKAVTRATESVTKPVIKPDYLMYIGANDDIKQLKVAGATGTDPLVLEVSGDISIPVPGRIREMVSMPRVNDLAGNRHMVGEGDHARIYLDYGGRVGLGNSNYNEQSAKAWTRLGRDYVQILPLGDGVVDVNSNLLIADRQALVATTNFSQTESYYDEGEEVDVVIEHENRVTFTSETPKEIRVPAGSELDLSSFGQSPNLQQIAIGGKIRLVFEAGSALRFPDGSITQAVGYEGELLYTDDYDAEEIAAGGVVLYLTDEAELTFEGQIEPQDFTQPFIDDFQAATDQRVKILGKGQIWLNKNAKMSVNNTSSVAVCTDEETPNTDITISLNRQSQFNIGTEVIPGGAFMVGDLNQNVERGIDFSLIHLRSSNPRTHIDREGFLGFAVGTIDKHGNINGDAARTGDNPNPEIGDDGKAALDEETEDPIFNPETDDAKGWSVINLYNVNSVSIDLRSGKFEHNNIVDGSDASSSLMAFGLVNEWFLGVNGPLSTQIVGGGNIMRIHEMTEAEMPAKLKVNIWDYASPFSDGTQYSILTSAPMLFDRTELDSFELYNDASIGVEAGVQFTVGGDSPNVDDFFDIVAYKPIGDQNRAMATVGQGAFVVTAGYINYNNNSGDIYPEDSLKIVRKNSPIRLPGRDLTTSLDFGTLNCNAANKPHDPVSFDIYLPS